MVDVLLGRKSAGYSFTDQAVSELFAVGTPTRGKAVPLMVTWRRVARGWPYAKPATQMLDRLADLAALAQAGMF
ncbi:MAG TPA: hypothetical protein VGL99_14515 [Chloroflexota bacterium]